MKGCIVVNAQARTSCLDIGDECVRDVILGGGGGPELDDIRCP